MRNLARESVDERYCPVYTGDGEHLTYVIQKRRVESALIRRTCIIVL